MTMLNYLSNAPLEVKNEKTGETNTVETSLYAVKEVGTDRKYALVGWWVGGDEYVRIVNKSGLKDPKKFNSYFEDHEPKW